MRTLPFVENWYETYKDKGFVVIGVHAPEFAFEQVEANVRKAVKDDGITYPVALDNNFATWNAYSNQYWPAHYLIDKQGNIRQTHFGEGKYDETEKAIQLLLGTSGQLTTPQDMNNYSARITPETYLGTARAKGYDGSPNLNSGQQTYIAKQNLSINNWTLNGIWNEAEDGITSQNNASISYNVQAKDVYLVVASDGKQVLDITLDGEPSTVTGESLREGKLQLDGPRLYHIGHFDSSRQAIFRINAPAGVKLSTFTFGG
jgi:hypothetical protein